MLLFRGDLSKSLGEILHFSIPVLFFFFGLFCLPLASARKVAPFVCIKAIPGRLYSPHHLELPAALSTFPMAPTAGATQRVSPA